MRHFGALHAITAGTIAAFGSPAVASDIVIGVPSWPSAQVTANVIAVNGGVKSGHWAVQNSATLLM